VKVGNTNNSFFFVFLLMFLKERKKVWN